MTSLKGAGWCAKRADHGVAALDGLAQCLLVTGIADNKLCPFEIAGFFSERTGTVASYPRACAWLAI
ncbi:hypothetical protein ACVMIX_006433 [Rhizobium leguminosarum]